MSGPISPTPTLHMNTTGLDEEMGVYLTQSSDLNELV